MQSTANPISPPLEAVTYPSLAQSDGADGFPIVVLAQYANQQDCTSFLGTVVAGESTTYPVGSYGTFSLTHFKPYHGSVTLTS